MSGQYPHASPHFSASIADRPGFAVNSRPLVPFAAEPPRTHDLPCFAGFREGRAEKNEGSLMSIPRG